MTSRHCRPSGHTGTSLRPVLTSTGLRRYDRKQDNLSAGDRRTSVGASTLLRAVRRRDRRPSRHHPHRCVRRRNLFGSEGDTMTTTYGVLVSMVLRDDRPVRRWVVIAPILVCVDLAIVPVVRRRKIEPADAAARSSPPTPPSPPSRRESPRRLEERHPHRLVARGRLTQLASIRWAAGSRAPGSARRDGARRRG